MGLSLQDAIRSGKRFKRPSQKSWSEQGPSWNYYLTTDDILADDWITEPTKKELSREDIERAYRNGYEIWKKQPINLMGTEDNFLKILIQELGL